ncbi:MAG: HAMP domain-containing histidine kinase [Rhodocyclaceae bacterium]|nr:HAMP domain-containing histidine kinase [Rhodocyclaceae bacterium]
MREIGHTRFYIAYTVSLHQDRGRHFTLVLALSAALTVLATALIGFWLSGRLTHQIEDLARRVRQLDESAEGEVLERHYPEREVAELAAAFDGYHARTASLLERERAFTADVSHELRTPLTALQTSCELMLEDSTLPPRSRVGVEKIAAAAMRLGELVNAFLLMAREEADGISSEVDLRECIEEAVDSVRERAVAKGLTLQVDIPESLAVRVPKRALHVVLTNLLANAVSYTEAGTVWCDHGARKWRSPIRGRASRRTGFPNCSVAFSVAMHAGGTVSAWDWPSSSGSASRPAGRSASSGERRAGHGPLPRTWRLI